MAVDPIFRSLDGVEITDGAVFWDYDLRVARVVFTPERPGSKYWDGWFETRDPLTGGMGKIFNGDRLWKRNPFTGQSADAWLEAQESKE
ncbi:hypothetical protein AB0E01_22975 [Nocardia vinacea]|uniref:hypothetical protein n=1 Tax=Nocardia vinacea TaxID=96468 RepID=UPI0033C6ED6F